MLSKCEFPLGIISPSKVVGRGGVCAARQRQQLFRASLHLAGQGCWEPGMPGSVLLGVRDAAVHAAARSVRRAEQTPAPGPCWGWAGLQLLDPG